MEKSEAMGKAPIGRLMLSMSVPMVISMALQAVYNIVDSAFVSKMSEKATGNRQAELRATEYFSAALFIRFFCCSGYLVQRGIFLPRQIIPSLALWLRII